MQVLLLVPPSERNLQLYCTWVDCGARDQGLLLADECQDVVRLEVRVYGGQAGGTGPGYSLVYGSVVKPGDTDQ